MTNANLYIDSIYRILYIGTGEMNLKKKRHKQLIDTETILMAAKREGEGRCREKDMGLYSIEWGI